MCNTACQYDACQNCAIPPNPKGIGVPRVISMNADSGEKTWLTPPDLLARLGPFDLDPCCPPAMPWRTAARMICRPDDGLAVDWTGLRVWCNPPYGREAVPFLRKMAENSHGGGILLTFARTDTSAWHDWIFPYASGFLFLRGRLRFFRADGTPGETAPAPSVLVAYSDQDFDSLCQSGLHGALLKCENCILKETQTNEDEDTQPSLF